LTQNPDIANLFEAMKIKFIVKDVENEEAKTWIN